MKFLYKNAIFNSGLTFFIIALCLANVSFSEVITQLVPSLSITENYTDNHHQTANNKIDEFSTNYNAGLSFGIIDKNASIFLDYRPEYRDYASFDEEDSWRHDMSINAQSQVSKHLSLSLSENFVRDLTRSIRTNTLEKHDVNTTSGGLVYEFGERDNIGINYVFTFDDYDNPNTDEYKSHNPSAFFSYWFTSQLGMELNTSYEKTKYDVLTDEPETYSGSIRLLKSITRHFDTYVSYAHTLTDQASGDHTIYNPSVGFDWRPTEDSGISMGIGVLFQEWDNLNSDNSQDLFFDLDAYKSFDFSRKGTLSITGASGYTSTSEDAASLGFEIYYRAGALLSYRLTRRLTGEIEGSYQISQFDSPGINRKDNTLNLGGGLVWSPLQWMSVRLGYSFIDFNTDAAIREDYQENIGSLSINLMPSRPVRFNSSNPRSGMEDRVYRR